MLRTALAIAAASAAVVVSATAAGTAQAPLLGVVDRQLARLDSQTLQPLPGQRLTVGSGGCAYLDGGSACWTVPPWAFSADGSLLAVARNDGVPSLRLVDVARMRVVTDVPMTRSVGAISWPTRSRAVLIEDVGGDQQAVITVDVQRRRVIRRQSLGGSVFRLERTPRSLVMLLAPSQAIGAARLVVVDRAGRVRSIRLDPIVAGSKLLSTTPYSVESRRPGLAVDVAGNRAFVVAQGAVATVDLSTLRVSHRELGRSPSARAKLATGYLRTARWLGNGLLAISGYDHAQESRPVGLEIVDTRSWASGAIDADASSFVVASGLLLVPGSGERGGITAFGFDGGERYRVLDGVQAWVAQLHGGLAYLGSPRADGGRLLRVLDVRSGRIIGERRVVAWVLGQRASGWWEPSP